MQGLKLIHVSKRGHRNTHLGSSEILTMNVIFGIEYFRKIILESSQNVSETTPWYRDPGGFKMSKPNIIHIKAY